MAQRIAVGGLLLLEHEKWSFSVHHDIIVGMRHDDVGVLRIRHTERNTLPQPVDHENCLETARRMLVVPAGEVSDVQTVPTAAGPFGAATFEGPKDIHRVWYSNRPAGLIVGVYICPADMAGDATYRMIVREAARLVAMAIFDRPAWGGDDVLTRAIVEHMERDEREGEGGSNYSGNPPK